MREQQDDRVGLDRQGGVPVEGVDLGLDGAAAVAEPVPRVAVGRGEGAGEREGENPADHASSV